MHIAYNDGCVYDGDVNADNKPHGQGKMTYADGSTYVGGFVDGLRSGYGEYRSRDEFYQGDFVADNFCGHGTRKFTYGFCKGCVYEGEWRDGIMCGKGKLTLDDGTVYEGDWLNDKLHGNGKVSLPNGAYYVGQFVDGFFCGHGIMRYADGSTFEGEFVDDHPVGSGKQTLLTQDK